MKRFYFKITIICVLLLIMPCLLNAIQPIGGWEEITCKITTHGKLGTGFAVKYKDYMFVVTNKHVINPGVSNIHLNMGKLLKLAYNKLKESDIHLPFDTTRPIPIPVMKDAYFEHPDSTIDIAVVLLPRNGTYDFRYLKEAHIGEDSLIEVGAEVYFLGYPSGLYGYEITTPILKQGIIAGNKKDIFYIDGNLFGGNSGGPVMKGNKLIGIVKGGFGVKKNLDIGIAIKTFRIVEVLNKFVKVIESKKAD